MLLTVAEGLVSLFWLCVGVHLLRKAKMQKDKPEKPVWWKQMERWQEDPELLGLFIVFLASCGILQTLWRFAQMALRFFSEK